MQRKIPAVAPLNVPSEVSYVGEDDSEFFTHIHGRKMNSMNQRYMLPADEDEVRVSLAFRRWCLVDLKYISRLIQRSELHHRMVQFLFGGLNYVGPVSELLTCDRGQRRPKVLDLGTGGGFW